MKTCQKPRSNLFLCFLITAVVGANKPSLLDGLEGVAGFVNSREELNSLIGDQNSAGGYLIAFVEPEYLNKKDISLFVNMIKACEKLTTGFRIYRGGISKKMENSLGLFSYSLPKVLHFWRGKTTNYNGGHSEKFVERWLERLMRQFALKKDL